MGTRGICNVCCDFIYLVTSNDEIIASSENRAFAAEVVGPSRVESIYINIDLCRWILSAGAQVKTTLVGLQLVDIFRAGY